MYITQQQYNPLPGKLQEKKTSVVLFQNAIKILRDFVTCLDNAISAAQIVESNPTDHEKVWRVLSRD